MNPKEKAKQLVDEFEFKVRDLDGECSLTKVEAIQCALLSVSIVLEARTVDNSKVILDKEYWEEVSLELQEMDY